MKKVSSIFLLIGAVVFSGALGFYLVKTMPAKQDIAFADNIENIKKLQTLDAAWSLTALYTYSTPNSDFDDVAAYLPRVRELRKTLSISDLATGDVPDALKNKLMRFLLIIESKEESIEHFKSNFAVMRNSLKFLPLASRTLNTRLRKMNDKKHAESINDLYERTNAFLQRPDEGTRESLLMDLNKKDEILMEFPESVANPLGNFISHARVLVERKIQLDSSIERVVNLKTNKIGDELIAQYKAYYSDALATQYDEKFIHFIFSLIAALLLAIAAITGAVMLFRQSQEFAEKLEQGIAEKTEAYEHAAGEASGSMVDKNLGQSMEGMGRMVATVTHEINTPLGYLGSNLQVLHNGMEKMQTLMNEFSTLKNDLSRMENSDQISARIDNFSILVQNTQDEAMLDELPEIVDDMEGGIEQIQHVIKDLGDFSRKDRSDEDWFDIKQCVESALKMAKKEITSGTKVQLDLKDVPEIFGSPAEMNQVLINLINNAAHAIESTGRTDGLIKIRTSLEKEQVMVSIMDNGEGIDEETRLKIFEPFFTTKDVGKGTGLGLAIVRRIVTKHGGKVLLKSIPGKGTNFVFVLPVKKKPQE
ncbi:MAG: HAMP domain-containing histidine kinase [Gammaproteobacteria bacterium]|nr:HAMP domain-containing histidine kinase [Gammaproteobacteria bacterium]